MGRACLNPNIIGQKAHNQCKCKERAGMFFKSISSQLEQQAKNVCNGANPEAYQTAAQFAAAMNLSEQEILQRYGVDINKENGTQTADTTARNQKMVYFAGLILLLFIIYFVTQKN